MRLIDLDEFLRQNCVDRMDGKTCEECKHHVLEVSCERLMEQPTAEVTLCHLDSPCEYQNADIAMPTAERVGKWIHDGQQHRGGVDWMHCSECGNTDVFGAKSMYHYCPNCGARMEGGEDAE